MTSHLLTGVRPYGEDPTDILITDGTITAIGPDAAAKAPADAVRHDLDGLIALPGARRYPHPPARAWRGVR